jgi:hypothetical protein
MPWNALMGTIGRQRGDADRHRCSSGAHVTCRAWRLGRTDLLPTLILVINSFALEVEDGPASTGRLVWGDDTQLQSDEIYEQLGELLARYRRTLQTDLQYLLQQFGLTRVARKVVGVGRASVRLMSPSGTSRGVGSPGRSGGR